MIPELPAHLAADSSAKDPIPDALTRAARWAASEGLSLVPVALRGQESEDDSFVVALDASGATVVVQGVSELGAPELVSALARAAAVREVGLQELGTWFEGGESGLREAWWQLRTETPTGGAGTALLILAASVHPEVTSALTLLPAGFVRVVIAQPVKQAPAKPSAKAAKASAKPAAKAQAKESAKDSKEPAKPTATQRRARSGGELSQHEQLQAVVALVGEASLVLADDDGGVSGRLVADGTIVVDGDSYVDPGQAAAAALGRPVADGWARWRFGADGPFLGEALQEALTRPARSRPNRRRAVRG